MQNPQHVTSLGRYNPLLQPTIVLSFATLVYFVGYIVILVGVVGPVPGAITAGVCVMIAASFFYLAGFILYRRRTGSPSFVGYVLTQVGHQAQVNPEVLQAPVCSMYNPQPSGPTINPMDSPPLYEDTVKLGST